MTPMTRIEGRAIPLGLKNIDTDVIIPAKWLKTMGRTGLSRGAFESIRAEPGNVFDQSAFAHAPILIAGDNFGCGSSREHAAWAIAELGIRIVIAPSFSDIFSGNAYRNGILTLELPQTAIDRLLEIAQSDPIHVDLERQIVTTPFQDRFSFLIDSFRKDCLMNGYDEIALTEQSSDKIAAHENHIASTQPWTQSGSA